MYFRLTFIFISITLISFSKAIAASPCKSVEQIEAEAVDEFCQHLSDSAKICYGTVNFEFAKTKKEIESKKSKVTSKEKKTALQELYVSAIASMRQYLSETKRPQCLAAKGSIEVVIEYLQNDLRKVNTDDWK